jgi:hypothetical protein
MAKLILALLVFLPAVALAGGGDFNDMPQQQMEAPQTKVVVQLPPDKGFFSSEVFVALIVSGLGLAGVVITVNARKKS